MVRMGSGPDASALEKLDEYLFDGEEGDDEGKCHCRSVCSLDPGPRLPRTG